MGYDLMKYSKQSGGSSKGYNLMQYVKKEEDPLPLERRFSQPNTAPIPSAPSFKMISSHATPEEKPETNYGAAWARGTLGSLLGRSVTPLVEKATGRKIDLSTLPEANTLGEKALGMVGNLGADLPLWLAGDALLAKPLSMLAKTAPVAKGLSFIPKAIQPALGTGVKATATFGGPINALDTAISGDGVEGFTDRLKEAPLMGLGGVALHGGGQLIGKGIRGGSFLKSNLAANKRVANMSTPAEDFQSAFFNPTSTRSATQSQLSETFANTPNLMSPANLKPLQQGIEDAVGVRNPLSSQSLAQRELDARSAFGDSSFLPKRPIQNPPISQRTLPQPERLTWTNRDTQNAGPLPIRSITDENVGQLPGRLTSPRITPNEMIPAPIGDRGAPGFTPNAVTGLPEPQSKIIIGKPKEKMSFKNAWDKFYTGVVNTQQPIFNAAKVAESDMGKLASNTKNVSGIVDHNFLKNMVDKNGDKVGESLKSTVEAIPKGQEEKFWTYMSQKHNIDRAREGKPVQANYTPEMSIDAVKIAEQANPEYKAIGEGITKWIDNFMQTWGVDTGIVNKEMYAELRQTYKNYFPTQRDFSTLEQSIPDGVSQKFASQKTPIRKATGSERDIIDPIENIMQLVDRTVRTAKYNEVGQSLLNAVKGSPEKMKQFAEVIAVKDGMFADTDNVISVLVDGKPTYLQINNKMLLDSMNGLPKSIGHIPVLDSFMNVFKGLITQKNPFFALRNVFRDVPTAYVYGSEANPFKFGAGLIAAGKDIVTNSPRLQKYQAVGGGGANFFSAGDVTKSAAEVMGKGSVIKKIITSPIKTIEKFNNIMETAPRLAEFNRIFDKTGDVTKSLFAANDVTVNFSRSGNITKAGDKIVPYLNAGVQGLDKFVRGFIDPKTALATIAKSGVAITTPTIVFYMVNRDNPNYQKLDNRTKDSFFLVPKPDGTFFPIPKSRELGVLFSSLLERGLRQSEGKSGSFKDFGNTVKTNFSPANPFDNGIYTPFTNLKSNKDFADRPIVPQAMLMDKRSAYLQYDEKTTSIAKAIGELTTNIPGLPGGLSPKQLDYLVKSYSGVVGQFGIPLAVPGGTPLKALKTQFSKDPLFSNQTTTDFYDKLDKLSASATDKNVIGKIPSKTLTPQENMRNSMNGVSAALSRGTKLINSIQASSDPLKESKIKAIKVQQLNLTNKAVLAKDAKSMQFVEDASKKLFTK